MLAAALAAALLLAAAAGIAAGTAGPASAAVIRPARPARAPAASAARERAGHSSKTGFLGSAGSGSRAHRVLIIGIPGLRWSDVSAQTTPALWRLATAGSVGSLVISAVETRTCPADAWLTLNSGARAMAGHALTGPCPALPGVQPAPAAGTGGGSGQPERATIPLFPSLVRDNKQLPINYAPHWGVLATAAGPGQCATAVGPGAAIALASPSGTVASYVPTPAGATRSVLNRCPLTVADLGALPETARTPGGASRQQALLAADRAAARVLAQAPAGAIVVLAGLGDGLTAHLRTIIVTGPGFGSGELTASSTRQSGIVLITDLTTSVLGWRGRPAVSGLVGSTIRSASRGPLAATVATLVGQDIAVHVYRNSISWFFWSYGIFEAVVMLVIAVALRGRSEWRVRRRRAAYSRAGVVLAALPAGTFLASLLPWPGLPHPALLLYLAAVAWGIVIAVVALLGPWRRNPLGSPGLVAAVTLAVIGVDVMTGSHLQQSTPFGLSALEAGRFYGVGNNAIGVYAVAGILSATWAGAAALRTGSRRKAVAAAAAVALFTVIASGWPGFGAKVGGTIAMVPAFLLVLAALGGMRITPRRGLIIAVSGLVLVVIFAVLNYVLPATGTSDMGAFVGQILHGHAGDILQRKIHSNLSSLTSAWIALAVPVVMAGTGVMIAWPDRLRLRTLVLAFGQAPLLRPMLIAFWLVGLLGWLADDSGVSVAGSALPFALPLAIALVTGIAAAGESDMPSSEASARLAPAPDRAG